MKTILISIALFSVAMFCKGQDTLMMIYKNKNLVYASSELNQVFLKGFGKYGVINLVDKDPNTAWVEGNKDEGMNEYFIINIPFQTQLLSIKAGYHKSEAIYFSNNRPKKIEIQMYEGFNPDGYATEYYDGYILTKLDFEQEEELKDEMIEQKIKLDILWDKLDKDKQYFLKVKINSVYKGAKWDDTCISEISFTGEVVIELSSDQRTLFKITNGEYDQLFFSPDFVYDLIAVGPNKRYCILTMMPAEVGEGRVETTYLLYDTEERMDIEIENLGEMYDFVKKNNQLYIEGLNKDTQEVELFEIPYN